MVEGGVQVSLLGVDHRELAQLVSGPQRRSRRFEQLHEVKGVLRPYPIGLARLLQLLGGVLPQRLQKPVPDPAALTCLR